MIHRFSRRCAGVTLGLPQLTAMATARPPARRSPRHAWPWRRATRPLTRSSWPCSPPPPILLSGSFSLSLSLSLPPSSLSGPPSLSPSIGLFPFPILSLWSEPTHPNSCPCHRHQRHFHRPISAAESPHVWPSLYAVHSPNSDLLGTPGALVAGGARRPTSLAELGFADAGLDDVWQKCGQYGEENYTYHDPNGNPVVE